MGEADQVKKYSEYIGAFWMNFSSLESILRLVLYRRSGGNTKEWAQRPRGQVGDKLPATSMTNYDTFSQICKKFNATLKQINKVDFSEIEKFRDALAHGRTSGDGSGQLTTIKYSKASKGLVTIEFLKCHNLDEIDELVARMGILARDITVKHLGATIQS